MTFAADIASDRAAVFLNTSDFAESVTYRVASAGTTSSVDMAFEDVGDSVLTDGIRGSLSSGDVTTPVKGDQVTRSGGAVYTVTFVTEEQGVWVLDMQREEEIT